MLDRRELLGADPRVLAELARRARAIEAHYRAAAEDVGQLYMRADTHRLSGLTRSLDVPMRRAFEIERSFAHLLRELQDCLARSPGAPQP